MKRETYTLTPEPIDYIGGSINSHLGYIINNKDIWKLIMNDKVEINPTSSRVKTIEQCNVELIATKDELLKVLSSDTIDIIDKFIEAKINYILRKKNLYYGAW